MKAKYEKAVISAPKTEERRRDLKVPLNEEITVYSGIQKEVEEMAEMRNLSAGGIYFESDLSLKKGERLRIEMEINGGSMNLEVEILRIEKSSTKEYAFGYGCRFQGLKRKQEMILRNFVYKLQMEQKKNKNNR